jgi:hypothetical protein
MTKYVLKAAVPLLLAGSCILAPCAVSGATVSARSSHSSAPNLTYLVDTPGTVNSVNLKARSFGFTWAGHKFKVVYSRHTKWHNGTPKTLKKGKALHVSGTLTNKTIRATIVAF